MTNISSFFRSPSFLRRVLVADAVTSAAMGVLLLVGATTLDGLLDLPADMLIGAAAVLLPFAALVAFVATRGILPRLGVWAVIALNAAWAVDSLVLLVTGWVEPNALGTAFIVAQAAAVGLFAELEWLGLRRAGAALA